ncbi:MAG: chemoreceptor glutamine deamidase CheD [Gammaproteobacteria bacterium]
MPATAAIAPALPESGKAERFVDRNSGQTIAKVLPGYFYVTRSPEEIVTVLGSCIAACVRDPLAGLGGMNHFMLPVGNEERSNSWGQNDGALNRFGNYAMENLINSLLKHGAVKSRLEVKLFGGGHVLDIQSDVGLKNASFAEHYLRAENLKLVASDVGGGYARKIIFNPMTGRIRLKRLRDVFNGYVATREKELLQSVKTKPIAGSVELF